MAVMQFMPMPSADALKVTPEEMGIDLKNADYSALMAVWGNGNAHTGFAIFYAVTMRLEQFAFYFI